MQSVNPSKESDMPNFFNTDTDTEAELTPGYRAAKLEAVLSELYEEADLESSLIDLLADARHLADVHDLDFAACDRVGYSHYSTERYGA